MTEEKDETNNDLSEKWIEEQFSTINDNLTLFKMQITNLQRLVKTVEKDVRKELKNKNKKENKPKPKRAPSGFAKPTMVTKELCEFMNKPEGTEIARTEVTKALVNYIKENNLIELVNAKSKIVPDEKLKNLLGVECNEINDLTYFNIQRYMNKHFYSKKNKEVSS